MRLLLCLKQRPKLLVYSIFLSLLMLLANLGAMWFAPDSSRKLVLMAGIYPLWHLWAMVGLFFAAKRSAASSLRLALGWGVLGAAVLCSTIGYILWVLYYLRLGYAPYPSPVEIFFFSVYPLVLFGVLLLTTERMKSGVWQTTALDIAIVMLGATLLFVRYLIAPTAVAVRGEPLLLQLTAFSQSVGDLLLCWAVLLLLYRRISQGRRDAHFFLVAGTICALVGDAIYSFQVLQDAYAPGGLLDFTWVLQGLFYGLAGIWQATVGPLGAQSELYRGASPIHQGQGMTDLGEPVARSDGWLVYLPYVWAIGVYILLDMNETADELGSMTWLSGGVGVMIALVLVRQMLTLRENRRQAQTLLETNQQLQREVAERTQAEQALARSESTFRAMWESASDAMALSDANGIVLNANPAYFALYGYPAAEIIGQSFAIIFPPEKRAPAEAGHRAVFHGPLEMPPFEAAVERNDGSRRTVESRASFIIQNGERVALLSTIRDITERKETEETIFQNEALFRGTFEQAAVGMAHLDPAGRWLRVNQRLCEIVGYSAEELLNQNFRDITYPPDLEADLEATRQLLQGKAPTYSLRKRYIHKTGVIVWGNLTVSLVRNMDGEPDHFVAVLEDISKLKQAEEELVQIEGQLQQLRKLESVGRLAGGIAHDFNNVLTAINGYSDLTLRRLKENDPIRRNIEQIKKAGERSALLTQQLLAFSRKQILQPKVLSINQIVSDTGMMLQRYIGEDIELCTFLVPDAGAVKVDVGQLTQVLINLVVNARDAMPQGGKLTIETRNVFLDEHYASRHIAVTPGAYVLLAVSDTGIGMDVETQQSVFEPFFTTKATGKGTGLGLSTVYGIVKQSGGNIWVYSEVGYGTTFKIYLPRVYATGELVETQEIPESMEHGTETMLLVEDEAMVRALSRQVLEMCGYTILEAEHGVEALSIFEQRKSTIDLIITDVVMPQMGGRELAERVAKIDPQMRVLFTSGYTDDAIVRHEVIDAGANFIAKPFTPSALAHKVREILDARHDAILV